MRGERSRFETLRRGDWTSGSRSPSTARAGITSWPIFEDITERGRQERLQLTQLSVDRAADLIHWIGSDGRLLYVSDSNCRRHGYSREEMLQLTIFDLDPTMTPDAWPEHFRQLAEARLVLVRDDSPDQGG